MAADLPDNLQVWCLEVDKRYGISWVYLYRAAFAAGQVIECFAIRVHRKDSPAHGQLLLQEGPDLFSGLQGLSVHFDAAAQVPGVPYAALDA